MVKVDAGEHNYYLDGYLKANLDASIKDVKRRDFDKFILVTGKEGSGKTTLSTQIATYFDPTFNLSRMCFTPEQFLEAVETAKRFQAIVFDETVWGLGSRSAMTKVNRVLIKVMSEMRSKNLFVIMCIPNFFMMDWYVAAHRSTGLLYIYQRGRFGSYDYPTKKTLYLKGRKIHSYNTSPNFTGRFVKYFTLDKEEYEKKKQEAVNTFIAEKRLEKKIVRQRNILIKMCVNENWMSVQELAKLLKMTENELNKVLKS